MLMQNLDGHLAEFHAGRNVKQKKFSFSILMTLGLHEDETVGYERLCLSIYIKKQNKTPNQTTATTKQPNQNASRLEL